jgi:hypothetical protein
MTDDNAPKEIIVRDLLLERIQSAIDPKWRLVSTQRTLSRITKTTLVVRQTRIERDPDAPRSNRRAYFDLVLACPLEDTGSAEVKMDDDLVTFLTGLDQARNVRWESATKGIWSDQYPAPCYVVSVYTTYSLIRKET